MLMRMRLLIALAGAASRRLVRPPGVLSAIGKAFGRDAAAEMELGIARIADRPFANAIGQGEYRRARHVFELDRWRRRLDHSADRCGRGPRHRRQSLGARTPRRTRTRGASAPILDRRRPAGEAEAVRFADDGIPRDATQHRSDLTRAQPVAPQTAKLLDPLGAPVHVVPPSAWLCP